MLFNLFWSIGITLGPAFSSYLYGDANPFKPFYLAGANGFTDVRHNYSEQLADI